MMGLWAKFQNRKSHLGINGINYSSSVKWPPYLDASVDRQLAHRQERVSGSNFKLFGRSCSQRICMHEML